MYFQLVLRQLQKKAFEFKLQLFAFQKYGKNKFIKSRDPGWPKDIEFDEKLKQKIENVYPKVVASEETVERYTFDSTIIITINHNQKDQNINTPLKNFKPNIHE